jgi:hypothetical protein
MQTDPVTKSWRIGAIIPMLFPLIARYSGYEIDSELSDIIIKTIDFSSFAISGIMLAISKFREQAKAKKS